MQSYPWTPVSPRSNSHGRRRIPGQRPSSRALGGLTSGMALIVGALVLAPYSQVPNVPMAVVALSAPSTAPTILPTSVAAPTSTRPTLPNTTQAAEDLETLALAGLPDLSRPEVDPRAPGTEVVPGVAEADAEPAVQATAVDLVIMADQLNAGSARVAVVSDQALVVEPIPTDPFECHQRADQLSLTDFSGNWDGNLIAQMTHELFECMASVSGMNDQAPTSGGWNAAEIWGFSSLSEQVAAEAVVVAYCESQAFDHYALTGDNAWGYGGLFQMGATEMGLFGFSGASKFDPVDNAYSAATYFTSMYQRGAGWGGWGPWAVVNTGYNDDVNNRVKVPVLPRFTSTDPDFQGRRGVELPEWAVDPWSFQVPAWGGCPTTGRAWPASVRV